MVDRGELTTGKTPSKIQPKRSEIGIVTALRGLAALSVVMFHLFCVTRNYLVGDAGVSFFTFGKYGVQIFFVISGFIICHSMIVGDYKLRNFPVFIWKRVLRIEPPYLLAVAFSVGYVLFRNHSGLGNGEAPDPTVKQVLLHIGYLIPFSNYDWLNIVFWTLAIEFQFYLIFSAVFGLLKAGPVPRFLVRAAFLSLMVWIPDQALFFYWSPVFLLGIEISLFRNKMTGLAEFMVSIGMLAVALILDQGLVIFLVSMLSFAAILWNPATRGTVLPWLGKISYSLYLFHTLIIFPIINFAFRLPLTIPNRIAFGTLALAAALLFSHLIHRWVESPFKERASSIKYK